MRLQDLVPPVTDADIEWVSALMSLRDLDERRREFLKRLDTLDVAACPGSGKTTLVVAKLAILGRHWRSRTQGICVLSHTNAAREEIESRLGTTEVGQSCCDTRTSSTPSKVLSCGFSRRLGCARMATRWL
jgi:DNA helicase-2/ATP-dependent DNA helicase PcrA